MIKAEVINHMSEYFGEVIFIGETVTILDLKFYRADNLSNLDVDDYHAVFFREDELEFE